jgi:MFS family permease
VTGTLRRTVGYWAVAAGIFISTMLSNGPGALYGLYRAEWDLSPLTITAIFAVSAVALLATLVILGGSSDVLGRRPVLLLAVVLNLASTAAFFFAAGVVWLFVARAMQGISNGLLVGPATAALVELNPRAGYRRASLVSTIALMAGSALGPLIFGLLAQYTSHPIRTPYIAHFAIVVFVLVGMLLLPRTGATAGRGFGATGNGESRWRQLVQQPRFPTERRRLFLLASGTLAVTWCIGSFWASLTSLITTQLLDDNSRALPGVILFAYFGLAGGIQMVTRHWDHRRAMLWGVVLVAVGIGLLELAISADSTVALIVAILTGGLGAGISYMGATAVVVYLATPESRAAVISAYNVIGYVAVAIPVMIVGVVATEIGLRDATSIFVVISLVVSAVLSVAIWREPALDDGDEHADDTVSGVLAEPVVADETPVAARGATEGQPAQ